MVEDPVAALLGLWLVGAVYSDGWAHLNVPRLESFFTPWHGALYTGLVVLAGWLAWLAWRRHEPGRGWLRALPPGYGLGAIGVLVFVAGGVGDMLWHIVFGVEAGIDALVSPTHLVLLVGGTLLLTSPLRAALRRNAGTLPRQLRDTWPAVLSLATGAAIAGFFLSYVPVFAEPLAIHPLASIPEGMPGHREAELPVSLGLAGYLVMTSVLVVPLLLVSRRSPLPAGSVTAVVAWVALPAAALTEMRYGVAAAAAVGGGLVADAVLKATRNSLPAYWVGALVPVLVWPAQLAGLVVTHGVGWSIELWFGVVVLASLAGFTLGHLPSTRASATAPIGSQRPLPTARA